MNLAVDPSNIPAPSFMDLGLSTINSLDEKAPVSGTPLPELAGLWMYTMGASWIIFFEKVTAVRDEVSAKLDYSYNTDF